MKDDLSLTGTAASDLPRTGPWQVDCLSIRDTIFTILLERMLDLLFRHQNRSNEKEKKTPWDDMLVRSSS